MRFKTYGNGNLLIVSPKLIFSLFAWIICKMLIDLTCGYVPLDEIEFDLEMLKIPAVVRA